MGNYIITDSTLKNIARAIRKKTDFGGSIKVSKFADMINSIKDEMKINYLNFYFDKEIEPDDTDLYWIKTDKPNNVIIRPENADNCSVEKNDSNLISYIENPICVAIDSDIYIFGIKNTNDNEYCYSLTRLNTITSEKTVIFTNSTDVCKGMTCAAIEDRIYIFGGEKSSNDYISYIKVLNTTNGSIETISELLAPMTNMSACAIGEKIYLFGGKLNNGDKDECYDKIYCFDTTDNSLKKLQDTVLPKKLQSIRSCASSNGYIYLFGGLSIDDIINEEMYKFDPSTEKLIKLKQSIPDFLSVNGLSCTSIGSKIYLFGNHYSGQFYQLNTLSDHLKQYSTLGEILYGSCACYVSDNNSIYVIGGKNHVNQSDEQFKGYFILTFNPIILNNGDVLITTDEFANQQTILTCDRLNILNGISDVYFGDENNIAVTTELYKYNDESNEWEIISYYN